MSIGKRPSYAWDSCTFISSLTKQGRSPEELRDLCAVEKLADDGDCVILTPSITLVEVLACKMTLEHEQAFKDMLQRSNVTVVSVTPRIAEKAREIRDYYASKGMNIAVPDSIHLATAVHYGATELHTYDGGGRRSRPTDLLRLESPLIEKWNLKVCKPAPPPIIIDPAEELPEPAMQSLFAGFDD
jgi:predicted nucleic acid-binding protein